MDIEININKCFFRVDNRKQEKTNSYFCNFLRVMVTNNYCNECVSQGKEKLLEDLTELRKKQKKEKEFNFSKKPVDFNFSEVSKNAQYNFNQLKDTDIKLIPQEVFLERLMCCSTCGDGIICPYYESFLKSKNKFEFESKCPDKEKYPNLNEYPPKNYWDVVNETVTVIVPARNEIYVNQTIKNLLDNSTGKIEIFVVLDGYEHKIDYPVNIIRNKKPLGKRVSINRIANTTNNKYLFVIDSHCNISKGWDTKLKCICDENVIAFGRINRVNENFEPILMKYNEIDEIINKRVVRTSLHKQCAWVVEVNSFIGTFWMMLTESFKKIGGFDESIGEWGFEGEELSHKVRCHGGGVLARTDVICWHMFESNKNWKLYKPKHISSEEFASKMISYAKK